MTAEKSEPTTKQEGYIYTAKTVTHFFQASYTSNGDGMVLPRMGRLEGRKALKLST